MQNLNVYFGLPNLYVRLIIQFLYEEENNLFKLREKDKVSVPGNILHLPKQKFQKTNI